MKTTISTLSLAASTFATLAFLQGCAVTNGGTETEEGAVVGAEGATENDGDSEAGEGYHEENVGTAVQPLVEGAIYRIRNLNSQLCVDIPQVCNPNEVDGCLGNPMIQTTCGGGGGPTQQFEMLLQANGTYKFRHVKTGMVILMAGPCGENGGAAVLHNDTTSAPFPNRNFSLGAPDAAGYVCIQSAYSGLFLNVVGSSLKPGAMIYQWGAACTGNSQKWRFEAL